MYFSINLRSRSVTMIIDDNVTIFILNKALNARASYLSHNEKRFISTADKSVSTLTSVRLQSQKGCSRKFPSLSVFLSFLFFFPLPPPSVPWTISSDATARYRVSTWENNRLICHLFCFFSFILFEFRDSKNTFLLSGALEECAHVTTQAEWRGG